MAPLIKNEISDDDDDFGSINDLYDARPARHRRRATARDADSNVGRGMTAAQEPGTDWVSEELLLATTH